MVDDDEQPARTVSRRRLSVIQRKEEIVGTALELFSKRPADEVSIDEVAAAAGASRALVYHYFGSKHALYLAALDQAVADMVGRLEWRHGHPLEQLEHAVAAYLGFAEERAAGFVTLLRGGAPTRTEHDQVTAVVERARQAVVDLVLRGLDRRDPSAALAVTLRGWVSMAETLTLAWLDRGLLGKDQLHRMLIGQLLASLMVAAGDDEDLMAALIEMLRRAEDHQLPPWAQLLINCV